jgi:hypothetical protein
LVGSCGQTEPLRRDADESLEVARELALVGESGTRGDLDQREFSLLKEWLASFDATGDEILMGRKAGGRLELPGEMIRAEVSNGSHLLQRRAALEVGRTRRLRGVMLNVLLIMLI